MTKKAVKKVVPKLKKKRQHRIDPDSLAAALNWVELSDPGDGANPKVKN